MIKNSSKILLVQFLMTAVGVSLPLFSTLAATKPADVKKQLQLTEGDYKIYRGDEELCRTGVDLEFASDEKVVALRVGQKFVWGNLGAPKYTEDSGDCKVEDVNTLAQHHVKSVSNYKCKDPKKNLVITLELIADKDQIRVNYERLESDKKNNQNFYCVYKK